jgi:hypothetical protein
MIAHWRSYLRSCGQFLRPYGRSRSFFDAIVSQAESLPRSRAQVAATGDYDDVPSVVLSASSSSPSQMKGREALARLNFHGKHI